jgi:hypothetical protein
MTTQLGVGGGGNLEVFCYKRNPLITISFETNVFFHSAETGFGC